MIRKVFRTGNSEVISIPREMLTNLGIEAGSAVSVELDTTGRQIILRPVEMNVPGLDAEFARQVAAFIDEYRPALEALAR